MIRIADIEAGSLADELELEIGTRIVRINGRTVRDGIDFTYLAADSPLVLEAESPGGALRVLRVEREPGERLGIVPAPDKIRECANECVFCFIDGNPDHVRDALWLRDDDFRLSFTYGSYVTLTNLGPRGLDRLVEQRISPLYVSVHATEPDVRTRLLKNDRAGEILDQLRFLLEGGLELHAQVVLCPEWNDGEHLDRTIRDLYGLGPGVLSLSIVPVGLTRYNVDRPVRLLRPEEARDALGRVERIRNRALRERGMGWCYGADELFLLAGEPLPGEGYYDDGALLENGVGAVRRFLDDLDGQMSKLPDLTGLRVRIMTGRSMAPFLEERAGALEEATRAEVEVRCVRNDFFGETVTVAGLLAGRDILAAVSDPAEGDVLLIPGEALNADDLFIDSLSLRDFRDTVAPARVVAAYEIPDALRSL